MSNAGCKIVIDRLPAIAAELQPRVGRVVKATCARIEARAKGSMSGAKHGRIYRKGRIGRRMTGKLRGMGLRSYTSQTGKEMAVVGYRIHRASAPGEAPAIDTGALANATRSKMVGPAEGMVYNNQEYAVHLEFRMNRAFLGPAANAEREAHRAAIAAALKGL